MAVAIGVGRHLLVLGLTTDNSPGYFCPTPKKDYDAVRNAIIRSRAKIGKKNSALETHLYKSLQFNPLFRYEPEHPTRWDV